MSPAAGTGRAAIGPVGSAGAFQRRLSCPLHSAAFTLVELLMVISLLSLLMAMLAPSLTRARRLARVAVCAGNLNSLNKALAGYAAENRDCLWHYTHAQGTYWINRLRPYHGRIEDVRFCPEAPNWTQSCGSASRAWEAVWVDAEYGYGSYGMNLWLHPMAPASPYYSQFVPTYREHFYRSLTVARGRVPTFADSNWIGSWPFDQDIPPTDLQAGWWVHQVGYFLGRFCIDRHMRTVNSAFVDGSVSRVELGELWGLNWSAGFNAQPIAIP